MAFFLLLSTKDNIFNNVGNQFTVAIDFYSMEKITMEVNGYRQLFG